jgi:DNA-directed RNA polymerase specialized sigma24 family protein
MNTEQKAEPIEQTPTEREIADAIAAGASRRAVALMASRYGERLGQLCMALVNDQGHAEELSVSTLASAYARLADFPASSSVKAWLFGIARQTCARHLEKNRGAKGAANPGRTEPEKARGLLQKMVPSERELLALRYQAGLSYAEISHLYGTTPKLAQKRVCQALKHAHELGAGEPAS